MIEIVYYNHKYERKDKLQDFEDALYSFIDEQLGQMYVKELEYKKALQNHLISLNEDVKYLNTFNEDIHLLYDYEYNLFELQQALYPSRLCTINFEYNPIDYKYLLSNITFDMRMRSKYYDYGWKRIGCKSILDKHCFYNKICNELIRIYEKEQKEKDLEDERFYISVCEKNLEELTNE